MKPALLASILFVASSLCQAAPSPLPKDVSDFLATRESCDHWRGEVGYDHERTADIAWATCQACPGTDANLAALKRKYRANASIMEKLGEFDSKIEPDDKAAVRRLCRSTRRPEWQK